MRARTLGMVAGALSASTLTLLPQGLSADDGLQESSVTWDAGRCRLQGEVHAGGTSAGASVQDARAFGPDPDPCPDPFNVHITLWFTDAQGEEQAAIANGYGPQVTLSVPGVAGDVRAEFYVMYECGPGPWCESWQELAPK